MSVVFNYTPCFTAICTHLNVMVRIKSVYLQNISVDAEIQEHIIPASILYKSKAGRYRPVSYPDGPITARYRFIKNAYWDNSAASSEKKLPSNMHKMRIFRSSCAYAKYHPGLCSSFLHSKNLAADSGGLAQNPQPCFLGLCCPRMPRRHIFA